MELWLIVSCCYLQLYTLVHLLYITHYLYIDKTLIICYHPLLTMQIAQNTRRISMDKAIDQSLVRKPGEELFFDCKLGYFGKGCCANAKDAREFGHIPDELDFRVTVEGEWADIWVNGQKLCAYNKELARVQRYKPTWMWIFVILFCAAVPITLGLLESLSTFRINFIYHVQGSPIRAFLWTAVPFFILLQITGFRWLFRYKYSQSRKPNYKKDLVRAVSQA
jgi:hypothetical protein